MTLRRKTLLLVVMVFAVSLAVLYLVSSQVLMEGYRRLEEEDSLADLQRGVAALAFDAEELTSAASDWARWDAACQFVEDHNEEFIAENLSDHTFLNLHINVIVFIDSSGKVVFSHAFDLMTNHEVPVPAELLASIGSDKRLTNHTSPVSEISGLFSLPDMPIILVSIPILPRNMKGESKGTLIWGRFLDRRELDRLSHVAQLPLSLVPYHASASNPLDPSTPFIVDQVSPHVVAGRALLRDVSGRPAWVLTVTQQRLMYQWGLISVRYFLAVLLMVALIFGIIVMVSTDRLILARLGSLTRELGEIGQERDLSSRVTVSGGDEIGQLGGSVNGLLANLERANQDRAALEQQMIQTQKTEAVGRLAGGIAHDFNNILTAVMGYTDRLSRRVQMDEEGDHCVEEIDKLAHRAATLTRQLLAFSRRQVLQPKILDLNVVMFEVQSMLRRLIGEDVELMVAPAPELGNVKADPAQLEQVLINLALNARDAMPRGGKLTMSTQNVTLNAEQADALGELAVGEYVTLAMTDTGHGMTSDVKVHLFEPFFTTKEVGRGTGLGLATCYGIVKQSGGHIDVQSEVGRGTTVTIFLPHVPEATIEAPAVEPSNEVPRGTETVLVVEDEVAVRQMTTNALREMGYVVLEAGDGVEALKVMDADPACKIDLLVTDIVMPKMDGTELATALSVRSPQTRVLFISGYPNLASGRSGILGENTAFLPKPFTSKILARRVREVLDLQHPGPWHLTC